MRAFRIQYIYNTGHNNGRVAQTIDNTLGETVNYSYDYLHRLTAATATNGTWGEAYTYDGFGNLTGKTPTQGYAPAMTGSADSNAAGGALSGQWDVEKRPMTQAATQNTTFYVYDPWGRRIWKQWYDTTYGTTNCEAYFYGATGQKLESYSCIITNGAFGATLQGINTYFAGKMLSEKGVFIATDRLGSVRGDSNGVSMSYYPWGEERGQGTTDNRTKFAGYYRDMPGQDYANARYYSQLTGSFWSPDPGGTTTYSPNPSSLQAVDPSNPGSWNRYLYALGDPVNGIDPTGAVACDPDDDDGCDPADYDDDDDGGGGCAVDTCVTVSATADPVTFMGDDDDDDDGDDGDTVGAAFSTTVTASSNSCVNASIAAGSLLGAGTGWFFGGGAGFITGGAAGSLVPVAGTVVGALGGASLGSAGGALAGASLGGALGGALGSIFCSAEHKTGARPSTKPKHQKGQRRKKGARSPSSHPKYPPRTRPDGWTGQWPPKPGAPWH